jgi:hypothetical protein
MRRAASNNSTERNNGITVVALRQFLAGDWNFKSTRYSHNMHLLIADTVTTQSIQSTF